MFDEDYAQHTLNEGELGIGDKGYEGVPNLLTPWKGLLLFLSLFIAN
jgi:hypothetical protein